MVSDKPGALKNLEAKRMLVAMVREKRSRAINSA